MENKTNIESGLLIAETENGYQPIGPVGSLNEAREIAERDLRHRANDADSEICPDLYRVWGRDFSGAFVSLHSFDVDELISNERFGCECGDATEADCGHAA